MLFFTSTSHTHTYLHTFTQSLSLSLSMSHNYKHTLSLFLSVTHTYLHTFTLSLSFSMATKLADPTLKSAVKTLSKYSYELFQKEYGAMQKYMKESRAKNFFIDEYESLLITHDNARCSNPYCVSMNFQCRHELFASMHSVSNEKDKDVFSHANSTF